MQREKRVKRNKGYLPRNRRQHKVVWIHETETPEWNKTVNTFKKSLNK